MISQDGHIFYYEIFNTLFFLTAIKYISAIWGLMIGSQFDNV